MSQRAGFLLKRLQLSGHPVLKDITISFCDGDAPSDNIYITGIIGANGTGKSHLLSALAVVFSQIHKAKYDGEAGDKKFTFTIDYSYCGEDYHISNSLKYGHYTLISRNNKENWIRAEKNGEPIDIEDILLPDRVVASTMTVTDKFIARTDDFYRYRGIRNENSVNTTGTRTIIRKTINSIMDCMAFKREFQDELKTLLNNLGLEEHMHIKYSMRYKDLFLQENMSADRIREIFEHWKDYFPARSSAPWGYNNYLTIRGNNAVLQETALFLSRLATQRSYSDSYVVSYDVMDSSGDFLRDAVALRTLTKLDLVSFPSISVVKKGNPYGFENSSSGETHLLCQFIGIMADIQSDSLILIDEPENSSHPEWQMKYIGWLKDIFKKYRGSHFIIATHSPLILANLKATESTIVRLKRSDNGQIVDEGGMESGCYSWTIDEILQNVMEMKSSHTVEFDSLMKTFDLALDNDDRQSAQSAYEKLVKLIRPGNVLAELLRIQMIGLSSTKYD